MNYQAGDIVTARETHGGWNRTRIDRGTRGVVTGSAGGYTDAVIVRWTDDRTGRIIATQRADLHEIL